jgi:hypothetical protein
VPYDAAGAAQDSGVGADGTARVEDEVLAGKVAAVRIALEVAHDAACE